ncbi:MAG: DUF2219 family protein, partial [Saprospiraceae bacterium]|nr:DUF2219 family protein [Saprospiraceae bacterium]
MTGALLRWVLLAVGCLAFAFRTFGQDLPPPTFSGFSVIVDQDYFAPANLNKDQNYTQGTIFSFHGGFAERMYPLSCIRRWIDSAVDSLSFTLYSRGVEDRFYNFSFGVGAFTPQDIGREEVVPNDRPYYSSLVFSSQKIGIRRPRVHVPGVYPKVLTTDFTLNIMGLDIAREFQTHVHKNNLKKDPDARPIPEGWQNQIS